MIRLLGRCQSRMASAVVLAARPSSMHMHTTTTLCSAVRAASSTLPSDMSAAHHGEAAHQMVAHEGPVMGEEEEFAADGDFDELEAASQEVHDLCYAMIGFLRRADPAATQQLFWRRVRRRFREPVPEHMRRLLHTHGDKGTHRLNRFRTKEDLDMATKEYLQWGDKLMLLLDKPLVDRLLESASKGHKDMRSDGVHQYKKYMERASWRTFPHRWYKHAPFEVQQLRADIPEATVKNTRFYRDHATVRYIFTLMEPQHPYREAIEKRMFEITTQYDPAASREKIQ